MVGPEEITAPQLKYILSLFTKLGWSQQYGIADFNKTNPYGVRIDSLTDISKREARRFIEDLKGRC